MPWYRWVRSNGVVLGLDHFGASAPHTRLYEEFGLSASHITKAVKGLLHKKK
jgi:transketolase